LEYEIIIDENVTKLESVYSGMDPPAMQIFKRGSIVLQMDKNISKLLLAKDFFNVNEETNQEFWEALFLNVKPKIKEVKQALKLFKQVKVPDWKLKKQILENKSKEIKDLIDKNHDLMVSTIENLLGYKVPKKMNIYLAYNAEATHSFGGCVFPIKNHPHYSMRLSNCSQISNRFLATMAHELMHYVVKGSKERKQMGKISHAVEEALFDLLMQKIALKKGKKIDWKEEIENDIVNRGGYHAKYIKALYEMLKPVLTTKKDDLIWKYIDWKKLEKIK
jgi:hypothetical protein